MFYLGNFSLNNASLFPMHTTVYPDGRVCISILHTPGEDPLGYESPAERWSPVQSIEKILLSVVSMLAGVWSHDLCRGSHDLTDVTMVT